jgi:hypothetical protein
MAHAPALLAHQEGVKPVASIVHYKQFQEWRASGVAFEFGDQTYTRPNRTMATYAEVRRLTPPQDATSSPRRDLLLCSVLCTNTEGPRAPCGVSVAWMRLDDSSFPLPTSRDPTGHHVQGQGPRAEEGGEGLLGGPGGRALRGHGR